MIDPEIITANDSQISIYRKAPNWNGAKTLAVGDIKFSSKETGKFLLQKASDLAKKEGFSAVLGPLNGDTWHSYRLVIESDGSAPFLLEPVSGEHDLAAFENTGFKPISKYLSAKASLENTIGEQPVSIPGISIECWDGDNTDKLLQNLFEMSTLAFSANHFFTPITFEKFLGIYQPMLPFIDKNHVLFATDEEGELQGFLFGTPNLIDQSGEPSAILKTYASRKRGVGHLLADSYHRKCIDLGFKTIIHALIHEDNTSGQRSAMHGAEIFRRYALMGKKV